ncbi:Acetyltransferase (GNAT) family protein [Nonomuraea solani]|uniref:Acetyltransferase (GNAT) family protein n=1 Tax=Nonomuraea solani TaxID=1144553 RepID=A0A1H6F2I0_9ACTN|nr:GNAT family N-acetyltransferase [Nonomuraea solani]SEH03419.1 Acetyltransferase (GNAT) family protein [Nonomuraea solani]
MDELVRGPIAGRAGAAGDLARALDFQHAFARRKAPRQAQVPGGFAVLDDRFPGSYDDNKLIISTPEAFAAPDGLGDPRGPGGSGDPGGLGGAGEFGDLAGSSGAEVVRGLLEATDEVLAGRKHRMVCVDDDRLGTALAPAFEAAGYERETNLLMAFRGRIPHDPPPAERLGLEELMSVLRRDWRHTLPQAPDEVIEGLALRVESRLRGADEVGFWGVRAPDGEIAARADLYMQGGAAQIESVFTGEAHRGKGHARTLMTALLAQAAEAELIFLVADADDWPLRFYTRLGFEPLGRTHTFLRA